MATFVLTWNPDRWPLRGDEEATEELERTIAATAGGRRVEDTWSVGARKGGIRRGDRAFLLRQHHERGIVASGRFASEVFEDEHWDGSARMTTYADVEWDAFVAPEDRLPVEVLKQRVGSVHWDRIQGSGIVLLPPADAQLEEAWTDHHGRGFTSPEELAPNGTYPEGAVTRVEVNRYERDHAARRACIARWGTTCAACGFDFERTYGPIGRGFIHVHHLKELSSVGDGYRVDPLTDLRPVCPNCHAMLHRENPVLTIAQLKERLTEAETRP